MNICKYNPENKIEELQYDMNGGRVIGEGGYGCVLKPAVTCSGKERKSNNLITKIQLDNETSDREVLIGKMVKKIPLSRKHFAPIVSNCYSKPKMLKIISKTNNCKFLNENPRESFAISSIPVIDGDDFKNHIYNITDSGEMLFTIIHSYVYLLFSLYMLDKNGIIHYDLKGENIMYDVKKKCPIIIDFGLSIPKKEIKPNFKNPSYIYNLKNYFYAYAPDYQLWCLDIHYLSFVCSKSDKPVKGEINNMVDTYIYYNKALQSLSKEFVDRFRELSIKQLNKYADMGVEDTVKYLYKYCNTWDNYSLSIMFLRQLKYLKNNTIDNRFLQFFEKVMCINIDPRPDKRMTIKKTHDIFVPYLNKNENNLSVFQDLVNTIEKNKNSIKKGIEKQIKYDTVTSYKMSLFK